MFSLSIYYPLSCQERKLQEGGTHLNVSGEKKYIILERKKKRKKNICPRIHSARENEERGY